MSELDGHLEEGVAPDHRKGYFSLEYTSDTMVQQVALLGAGGKMGGRITDQLAGDPAYEVRYVEPDAAGQRRLADRGINEVHASPDAALPGADVAIMAVPDELIGTISETIVPLLDEGSMLFLLDPAAAHAGVLPERSSVTVFISHPCHPSLLQAERSLGAADPDWFGGRGLEPQDVVCALHRGPDSAYAVGEAIARDIYAPVERAHRVTTEQMAILEPALVESLLGACLTAIRDGMERAVEMGVPEDAARAMLYGHLRIEFGIVFGHTDFPFSDGAKLAVDEAKEELFVDDWADRVFDPDRIEASVEQIATPDIS